MNFNIRRRFSADKNAFSFSHQLLADVMVPVKRLIRVILCSGKFITVLNLDCWERTYRSYHLATSCQLNLTIMIIINYKIIIIINLHQSILMYI